MEQSASWKASSSSASPIPCIVRSPNIHYRIHKSPPGLILHVSFYSVLRFYDWELLGSRPNTSRPPFPSWRTTPCRLSARSFTAYLQAVPPSATWGRAVRWWQGFLCHGHWCTVMYIGAFITAVWMWQHCVQTRMAVMFTDVRADLVMVKREEVQWRHYCGWLYHSLSAVNIRVAINCIVEQFFCDDIAVTVTGNCDSLPRCLRRFSRRLTVGCFADVPDRHVPSIFRVEDRWRQQPHSLYR